MVDIFEGGPIVTCPIQQIRTLRESRRAAVAAVTDEPVGSEPYLIAAVGGEFRACRGTLVEEPAGGVRLPREVARALNVAEGDRVRFASFRTAAGTSAAQSATVESASDPSGAVTAAAANRHPDGSFAT